VAELITPLASIDAIRPHPNADRLDLATVGGWQVAVSRDGYRTGDFVLYVPPQAVVPDELAEPWGVKPYLRKGNRVGSIRLRGEPSHGFIVSLANLRGANLAAALGITKYEPPERWNTNGVTVPEHGLFFRYTEIENLRHYPDVIPPGTLVEVSEKIHGTNSRIGCIDGQIIVGTHRTQFNQEAIDDATNLYAHPLRAHDGLRGLLLSREDLIVYGEIFGRVQKLRYGSPNGLLYRVFDIAERGIYLAPPETVALCQQFDLPHVPFVVDAFPTPDGLTDFCKRHGETRSEIASDQIREGFVLKPVTPITDPRIGRVVMKYVSDQYLTGDWE
jgi:RNA ligase (TIGR02306 family)